MCLQDKSFENKVGRGEIAQAIFPFFHSIFTLFEKFLSFLQNLKLSSANSFSLERSKACHLGKG